jgi:hypothetical protein
MVAHSITCLHAGEKKRSYLADFFHEKKSESCRKLSGQLKNDFLYVMNIPSFPFFSFTNQFN